MAFFDRKHSQFELFPDANNDSVPILPKRAFVLKDLTLSQENIIVVFIVSLMVCILLYSFGVDQGKKTGLADGEKDSVASAQREKEQNVVYNDFSSGAQAAIDQKVVEKNQAVPAVEQDNREIIEVPIEIEIPVEEHYTIQVASFQLEENAKKEASQLEKKGYDIYVVPKGKHSIVCVGKFGRKEEAKAFSGRLKGIYGDFLIRRL